MAAHNNCKRLNQRLCERLSPECLIGVEHLIAMRSYRPEESQFESRMLSEIEMTDFYFELFDLESGNVVEDYEQESDAIQALIQVVTNHGFQAIETFALTHVTLGRPRLIAMQDELVLRVEQEMGRLVPQRRTS